ncbi:MAG: hypothetical protein KF696_08405 [Planctomycetes bacterium]|nr:hypothetical protein [Planctomycetota bacterium]MCW8135627.1 hypothetical protein [Planctomycetota bacterium]
MRIPLAALLLLALACHIPGAAEDAPAPDRKAAMKAAARAVGGSWVSEAVGPDGKTSWVRSETTWSENKRILRARTWSLTADNETLDFEGGMYWHPGTKRIEYFAVMANGGLFKGHVEVKQGRLISRWSAWMGSMTMHGENHTEYTDDDTQVTKIYTKTGDTLRLMKEMKTVRKEAGWKPAKPEEGDKDETPDSPEPSSLEHSGKLVGGQWVTQTDPDKPYNGFTYEWGIGKQLIWGRTFAANAGATKVLYEGAQYWHPGEKKLRYFECATGGEVYEGEITRKGETEISAFKAYGDKGVTEYEQHSKLTDKDTLESTVFIRQGEEFKQAHKFKFTRKPADWPPKQDN